MPRAARTVIPGLPHHVVQRGIHREGVFFSDDDRSAYLAMLQEQAQRFKVSVLGYCLMSDHVHLVVVPRTETALAQAIGRTHWLYSQYLGRTDGQRGELWRDRFQSCAVDGACLWDVLLYVERNPVRTRQVRYAWTYRWSSAAAHAYGTDPGGMLDLKGWQRDQTPSEWRNLLVQADVPERISRIRLHTSTGRPLADEPALSRLERRLGRRLRALPVGRPRKSAPANPAKSR